MLEEQFNRHCTELSRRYGRLRVWWRYNFLTVVVLVSAMAAMGTWLHVERHWRVRAEAQAGATCTPATTPSIWHTT